MFKLIACNVFQREACWCVAQSPHAIDVEFTELGEHVRSEGLRNLIQGKIDAAEASGKSYEAILLLFGLCGNATAGLQARTTKLVMPRAHDCCTILLGSRGKFREHFGAEPSTPFGSAGYVERGEYFMRVVEGQSAVQYGDAFAELVKQYGEEDAKFIWEQMHPEPEGAMKKAVFIELPQTKHLGYAERFKQKAAEAGKEYVELEGDIRLIRDLIFGKWNEEEFLIVKPGEKVVGVYDWDEVVRAGKSE